MKLVEAFFKMVRLPNLFFIALTQFLFQFCIILPIFKKSGAVLVFTNGLLLLLILSSVLIAAAGYIINDYFDINIDQVNKPQKKCCRQYHFTTMGHALAFRFIFFWGSNRVLHWMENRYILDWTDELYLCSITICLFYNI